MSAYIVSNAHIRELAVYFVLSQHYGPHVPYYQDLIEAQHKARILAEGNLASTQARYTHTVGDDDWPLPMPEIELHHLQQPKVTNPLDIIRMAHCLDYQSCEVEDWEDTNAWKLIMRIIARAAGKLPGYDTATRDYDGE